MGLGVAKSTTTRPQSPLFHTIRLRVFPSLELRLLNTIHPAELWKGYTDYSYLPQIRTAFEPVATLLYYEPLGL